MKRTCTFSGSTLPTPPSCTNLRNYRIAGNFRQSQGHCIAKKIRQIYFAQPGLGEIKFPT